MNKKLVMRMIMGATMLLTGGSLPGQVQDNFDRLRAAGVVERV